MRLAADRASAVWPGEFNQFILLKGPGYPFFLAVTSISGLPLSAAHALFQTAAISATAWIVFRVTRSQWGATATFVALAFCPVGLALHRVLPDQIYWAQTLLAFSSFATIMFAPPTGRSSALIAAGLTGLIFGWTFLTGEGGVWFLPACVLVTGGAVLLARHSRDKLLAVARNFCVVAAGFVAVNLVFLTAMLNVYGSPVGVDFYEPYLTSAQWTSFRRNLFTAVETVLHPNLASCSASVEGDDFKRYWKLLNYPHVKTFPPNREVAAAGWYYDTQSIEWPAFKGYTQDGQEVPAFVKRQASPDLQRFFSDDQAADNRFEVTFLSPNVCEIAARTSDGHDLRVVLDPQERLYTTSGSATLFLNIVSDSASGLVNPGEKFAASLSFSLIGIYEGLLPFLLAFGLIAAVTASWRAFSAHSLPAMLLTALAAWVLTGTRIALLASANISAFPAVTIPDFASATYMAIMAACLSLTALSVESRLE
jgi:hypothetical protein